jgi:transcriptional regulator with XRE-family HTH domain
MTITDFTNWLNDELIRRGWRQSDLVRATGISRSGISLLTSGQIRPAPQTVMQLSRVFKVPPDFIMRKVGYLPPKEEGSDPTLEEVNFKYAMLPPDKKQLVLDYLDFLIGRFKKDDTDDGNNYTEKMG